MIFDTLFTLELLLVAVVVTVILGGVIYLAARNRRIRRETGRQVETAGGAEGGAATDESDDGSAERAAPPRREFYKGTGLETRREHKAALVLLRGVPERTRRYRRSGRLHSRDEGLQVVGRPVGGLS
jgi:hypothetical protein